MEIAQAEKILKALANKRRLKIVKFLGKNKKATVTVIANYLKLSFKSTSRHLSVLKSAGIIDSEQVALMNFYYIVAPMPVIVKTILVLIG